jgi:hypothetical protein
MKIKVEKEKIIEIVKKLEGVELVLETPGDAKEAIELILKRTDLFHSDHYKKLKDVKVTSTQEYKTSAVDYKIMFLLELIFGDDVTIDAKAVFIKDLQMLFNKV